MAPEQVRGKPADRRSRPLRLRDDPLRDAVGPAGVPRRHGGRHDHGDPDEGAAGPLADEQGDPPGPRPDRAALPREEPGGAVRVGARRRVRPRVALERLGAHGRGRRAVRGGKETPRLAARRRRGPRDGLVVGVPAYLAGRKAGDQPPPSFQQLTFRRGEICSARFAPDGQTVVYSAAWDGKPVEIFVGRLESPESRPFGLAGAEVLSISSSGEMAVSLDRHAAGAFRRSGTLAQVSVAGGVAPREILEDVQWADWAPDGKDLAVVRDVSVAKSGSSIPIGQGALRDDRLDQPSARLADGRSRRLPRPSVAERRRRIGRGRRPRRQRRRSPSRFASAQGLAWSPDGTEVWFTAARSRFARSIRCLASPARSACAPGSRGTSRCGTSRGDGRVLVTHDTIRDGDARSPAGRGEGAGAHLARLTRFRPLSADGKTMLFTESGEGGGPGYSVYIRKTDGSPPVRLGEGFGQALSPDGKWAVAIQRRDATIRSSRSIRRAPARRRSCRRRDLELEGGSWFAGRQEHRLHGERAGPRAAHLCMRDSTAESRAR